MKLTMIFLYLGLCSFSFSQTGTEGVSISATPTAPHSSAILDIQSQNKGVLITRLSYNDRENMVGMATGLLIYQLDNTPGFYYYDGAEWKCMSCCSGSPVVEWRTLSENDIPAPCFQVAPALTYGGEALQVSKVNNVVTVKGWFQYVCDGSGSFGLGYQNVISTGFPQLAGTSVTYNAASQVNGTAVLSGMVAVVGFGSDGITPITLGPNIAPGSYIYIDVSYQAQ